MTARQQNVLLDKNPSPIGREKVYFTADDSGKVCYFTRREAQCVYHLVDLRYRWRVAEHLGLSRRTVDAYIETAKRKLSSPTQKALIRDVLQLGFPSRMRNHYSRLIG